MISFRKIRRVSAIFFGIISVMIVAFHSSSEFANHLSVKSQEFFIQSNSGNPIVYYKASENLSFTHSLPKVQAVGHHELDIAFDLPSLEIATSEALFVVASLRNVFYVFISINAP
jgi:hypothetical protein